MWNTIEEFAQWYVDNNFPLRPPFEDPVYVTDVSYSYVLFREGQYQAELYLIKPNATSGEHSHPGAENIIMALGGDLWPSRNGVETDMTEAHSRPSPIGTSLLFGAMDIKFDDTETHKLTTKAKGGALISFEKWPEGVKPTSLTVNWEGEALGDYHASIIKKAV